MLPDKTLDTPCSQWYQRRKNTKRSSWDEVQTTETQTRQFCQLRYNDNSTLAILRQINQLFSLRRKSTPALVVNMERFQDRKISTILIFVGFYSHTIRCFSVYNHLRWSGSLIATTMIRYNTWCYNHRGCSPLLLHQRSFDTTPDVITIFVITPGMIKITPDVIITFVITSGMI